MTDSLKLNKERYALYILLLTVFSTVLFAFLKYPLFAPPQIGDQLYYRNEVEFFAKYGAYHTLAQGTSFIYTCLVFLASKLFFTSYLAGARILTVICFLLCCRLLFMCLEYFPAIGYAEKYLCIAFYCLISSGWILKGLPDIPGMAFFLSAFYLVLQSKSLKGIALAGVLLFIGFACKPVALLLMPGFVLFIFCKGLGKDTRRSNAIKTFLFSFSFLACFIVYHIPGYLTYHKLMLEDKIHTYNGPLRVDGDLTKREGEIYLITVPNNNKNAFTLTYDEVAAYKQKHPEVNLNLGYTEFVEKYPALWLKTSLEKTFLSVPYDIQLGFFFSKWTSVNRWINNMDVIHGITAILFLIVLFFQRKYVKQSFKYFIIPASYAVFLAFYSIGHFEENWLLLCLPFLALPLIKYLCAYVNINLLLILQLIYLSVTMYTSIPGPS